MDAFENLVAEIMWAEGYWVRTSVRANLTKAEKVRIGRPSAPRWEIDVVAYSGRDNVLQVIECKSYFDSRGVAAADIIGDINSSESCFKLFVDETLRETVFERLRLDLAASGACAADSRVRLGLACGRIASDQDRTLLKQHFAERDWLLLDEAWLKDRLRAMAQRGYENEVSAVVAKILLRGEGT